MIYKFFIFCFLTFNLSFAQKSFIYKVSADIDYDSIEGATVKKLMKSVEKELNQQSFILVLNKNKSLFNSEKRIDNQNQNLNILNIAKAMTYVNEEWFYNADKSYLQLNTKFMNKPLSVEFNELPEWRIENNTKAIGNYKVIKATTSRKFIGSKGVKEKEIEAWFCPDIPVPHGPMGAVGLPGLVIQLRLQNTIFTLDQVIEEDSLEIDEPDKSNTMPSKEFYTLIDQKVGDFKSSIQN